MYYKFPTPKCCETAKKSGIVYLMYDSDAIRRDGGLTENDKPQWYIEAPKWDTLNKQSLFVANYCPFCGKPCPEIKRKKNPPKKIRVITDSGYYCDTCFKRLMCCTCFPPEHIWLVCLPTKKNIK